MKQINGYWVDENNNRWDCDLYDEEEAFSFSKTLINCTDCIDCIKCTDCTNCKLCNNFYNCHNCTNCINCRNCHNCTNCINCDNCINCGNCDNCIKCDNCYYCYHCNYCYSCDNFKTNPQIYKTREIGSRNSQTTFYYGETHKGMEVQVVCGCFRGNLEEFETAVMKTHKNCDEYREQYLREIEKVKVLFDLN